MNSDRSELVKSWFIDLVKKFREQYLLLPENTQKFVWSIEDFNAPCQILSLTLASPKMTFLWVTKDKNRPDTDVRCYGPVSPDKFLETAQNILSDGELYKNLNREEAKIWNEESFGKYLENQFLGIIKIVKNQPFIPHENSKMPIVGMKIFIPYDGFSWIINGDITSITPDKIVEEIFQGAKQREGAEKNEPAGPKESTKQSEELISGYSTYFYPPVWLGKFPEFDFKSRVNGIFIFPVPTHITHYKKCMISLNQKGLFFVGNRDKHKCIQYMNEIIGTAILLGYNFDTVSENDLGETTVTKDKGERRSQTFPKSITRYWQAEQEISPVNEIIRHTYSEVSVEEMFHIIETAESAIIDQNTSNLIVFYAYANQHLKNGEYMESFLFDWLIIEKHLRKIWDEYLEEKNTVGGRKKRLKSWTIDHILESLYLSNKIDQELFENTRSLKDKRNGMSHEGYNITKNDAEKCHELAERMIRTSTGIERKSSKD